MDPIRNCLEKIAHCLNKGGPHAAPDHIRLMQICRAGANFAIQQSSLHELTCGVCAEVCRRCRESRFDRALAA